MIAARRALAIGVVVAAVASACDEGVELFSAPRADGGAGAPSDGGVGGAEGGSGGGSGGHAGGCSGAPIGTPCDGSAECCSGWCSKDASGQRTCRPTPGCAGLGALCDFAGQCCSLACVAVGGELGERRCDDAPACAVAGAACVADADCCGGRCVGEVCAPPGAACRAAGEACSGDAECCGAACEATLDGERCALLQGCRVEGEQCAGSADCCSSSCETGVDGVARCRPLAPCTQPDDKTCSRQAGELCKDDAECCTRSCEPSSDGPKRCAYLGGCHQDCELCAHDGACCAGTCSFEVGGVRRCGGSGAACAAAGQVCGGPTDCCPAGPGGTCDEPAAEPPKRCLATGGALPDGEACLLATSCAGGFCVPGPGGQLVCASTCRADGEECTSRSDCCTPLTRDCMFVGGVPVCVELAH